MKIEPFEVEQWMDTYETVCKYNIAETCCASISISSLIKLSSMPIDPLTLLDPGQKQDYGHIRGTPALKGGLASLYSVKTAEPLPPDNVLITPGAIAANFLVFYALVGPGDHVICHHPTYQQLYSVPEALGAKVDLWKARPEKKWLPDIEELKSLIQPNTKLIVLNNPNNPTGTILPASLLTSIIDLAREHDITILSDEVYRPLFHGITPISADFPNSILSLKYDKVIATGSLSKAYSLAGIRVGWIASRSREIIELLASARDYTNISVGQMDQAVAAFALSPNVIHNLLARNIQLAKTNLNILSEFIDKYWRICSWTKPVAGTTAFVKFERDGKAVDSVEFCKRLLDKTGVLFLPGTTGFGKEFEGYVRIGFVNETDVVREGFEALDRFMRTDFGDVPTVWYFYSNIG